VSGPAPPSQATFRDTTRSIYGQAYSDAYPELYIAPWTRKHSTNVEVLKLILLRLQSSAPTVWLDTCCGHAWHFSRFPSTIRKVGADVSRVQLEHAVLRNPDADFVHADIRSLPFAAGSFSLITNFWGSYCYLGDESKVAAFFQHAASLLKPGGFLYAELLLPQALSSFNGSDFAAQHACAVRPLVRDYSHWMFTDSGGEHRMCSPSRAAIIAAVESQSVRVETFDDGGFMTHLVGVRGAPKPGPFLPRRSP
jgi:SAM-dependent methyltransferase